MEFFSTRDIVKRYANHLALNKVSIDVPEQSIFGLLGPNGAGKTTLIRIINQITAPDQGEVFFNGEKLRPEHVAEIGYLPEERGLYKKMKVGEQAMYLAQLKGMSEREAKKKLRIWFEKYDILSWWDKKVEELSKGMAQKVQFLVTIVHEPRLLIFDEPFSGFDPINANMLKEEILSLKENGSTVIFSTHNMGSVEEICDHIALINRSEKILEGPVRDIRQAYKANMFEVDYNGFSGHLKTILNPGFEIIEEMEDLDFKKAKIRIANGEKPNELLKNLIAHTEVHNFNEILPSMNDIFIQKVRETNPNYVPDIEE
ncbi:MAG: ATP-binding cassette domain-containing protein [Bacteroidales bacterium]|nr:ATP-binding cassette domain-containing protein [Bacteroidales bacterium]